jgi:5'-nucleotidase
MCMKNIKRPKIFVTNDDGYSAYGISILLEVMKTMGDVLCIAPARGQSGMSHAITFSEPIKLCMIHKEEGYEMHSLEGTPVDCVKMALDRFYDDELPDLIVSGINHGSNASICSIYSGTVAVAREGAVNGIPAVAFSSLDFGQNPDYKPYKPYIKNVCEHLLQHGLEKGVFLNVNFPLGDTFKGMRVCRQTQGVWVEEFERRLDPHNREYFWLTGHFDNYEPQAEDSDEWALKHNYVAIVPLKVETTCMQALQTLSSLNQ